MSELLLGYNIFETAQPEKTIENILEMPLPNFSQIRPDIDERLNLIMHTALKRPRDERYQSSEEMLTELESFIYGEGYGPTNEKQLHIFTMFLAKMARMQPFVGIVVRPNLPRISSTMAFQSQGLRKYRSRHKICSSTQLRQSLKILQVPTLSYALLSSRNFRPIPFEEIDPMMRVWIPMRSNPHPTRFRIRMPKNFLKILKI